VPAWKLDLIFECQGRGWEETYYADFAGPSFTDVAPVAQALAEKRIALAAPPVVIKAYRLSDPLSAGKQGKAFYYKPAAAAPPNAAWGTDGATEPTAAVNVGWFRNTGNMSRRIQMRGCPDKIMTAFGQLQGDAYATWLQLFAVWKAFVLGSPRFGWLNRPTLGDAAAVSYSLAVDPVLPVFTTVANFFTVEDADGQKIKYVRMRGFNGGNSELNRELIVRVLTRSTFTPVAPIAAGPMISPGMVQRYNTPTLVTADSIDIEKVGTRKPGAPLLHTPGRRRGRART